MKVGCYMLVLWGILGLVYSQRQLANLLQERKPLQSLLQNLRNVQRTTEPALSCTGKYAKMEKHTLCLTDSPNVTRSGVTEDEKNRIVQKHNSLRASVQPPASDLAMLKWDDKLAAVADKWAKQCVMDHDGGKERYVYELGMSTGQNAAGGYSTWEGAIQGWYNEIRYFKYGLAPQTYLGKDGWKLIGHFTQVVSNDSLLVGCGYAECSPSNWSRYYICNYAHARYDNAHPYTAGTRCGQCPNNCNNGLCDCKGRVCLNGGTLDINTCKCECTTLYSGESCEIVNCPVQDGFKCGRYDPVSTCDIYESVRLRCPYMCDICNVSARCNGETCNNVGTLDPKTCKCECPKIYSGASCEILHCPAEDASGCGRDDPHNHCGFYAHLPISCPYRCGICGTQCNGKRCRNGGTLNTKTCSCSCRELFTGETCEIAPCNGKKCNNGGTLDLNTCSCSCKQPYTGDTCETVNCPVQDDFKCGRNDPVSNCDIYESVRLYCPYMCGICNVSARCNGETCNNVGTLDPKTCKCECPKIYSGASCEILHCPAEDASGCGRDDTHNRCGYYADIPISCPYMCGICGTQCNGKRCRNGGTLNTKTCSCSCRELFTGETCEIAPCNGKKCSNGGTLDLNTCSCSCKQPYTGDTCETVNCPVQDDFKCGRYDPVSNCDIYASVRLYCPYMCGICDVSARCNGETCNNVGTLDPKTCKCECPKIYSGASCEILNCPAEDDSNCGRTISAKHCGYYADVPISCPYMCGICKKSSGRGAPINWKRYEIKNWEY